MANTLTTHIIHLDDFSANIDLSTQYPAGMRIHSIEWAVPGAVGDTMVVLSGGISGVTMFHEKCCVAKQSLARPFYNEWYKAPFIKATSGTTNATGSIIICRGI